MANVIIGLLMIGGPQSIYALNKHFEQSVSLFYRASLGALRTALTGLLERGEIEYEVVTEQGRRKKLYRPTQAGHTAFFGWLTGLVTGSNLETAALSRVFFLGLLTDAADRRSVLQRILDRNEEDRAELRAIGDQLDTLDVPEEHMNVFRYQRATLDYGLATHRVAAEFFGGLLEAEARIPPRGTMN